MKLQITVSDELVEQIDKYANMMGISRSALCATFIGQGVMNYNKSYQILDKLGEQLGDVMFAQKSMKDQLSDDQK